METSSKEEKYTIQEYLEMEGKADFKSEYYDGEIFAQSGGSLNHSLIQGNIIGALKNALRGGNCLVTTSELQVYLKNEEAFVYPDAAVICGPVEFSTFSKYAITNPKIIVEVLSPSTEGFDRGGKFHRYISSLESLQEYVLVEQALPSVEVFKKQKSGKWLLSHFNTLTQNVRLESLNIELSMEDIFEKIVFQR